MLRRYCATLSVLSLCLALAGCGVLETKKIDYKSAKKAPTLEVPPDLTAPSKNDRFAVPESGSRGSATLSTYNAERVALLALYHDTTEVITGDMPTPVKYYNDDIKNVYKNKKDKI